MKIKIKNLARITEADFELKPLTIFIGKNNTNKSYCAYVIYALIDSLTRKLSYRYDFEEKKKIVLQYYDLFEEKELSYNQLNVYLLKEGIRSTEVLLGLPIESCKVYTIRKDKESLKKLIKLYNKILNSLLSEYVGNLTIKPQVRLSITEDLIRNFGNIKNFLLFFSKIRVGLIFPPSQLAFHRQKYSFFGIPEEDIKFSFLIEIFQTLISTCLDISWSLFYFPAARTGMVLALDEIVSGLFEKYIDKRSTVLNKPIIDFIRHYYEIKQEKIKPEEVSSEVIEILTFLEERLLEGKIFLKKEPKNDHIHITKKFIYRPKGFRDVKLELGTVSSMVTELAPLYSFLSVQKVIRKSFFIIEEPEAHLHPSAQLEMVKLLGMLVRNGARVLITTHSDYILNFINVLIRSSQLSDEERRNLKFKRKKQDLSRCYLKPEEVGCYLFKEKGKEVEAKELEITEHGISLNAFEEVLDEIIGISEHIDKFLFKELIENVSG